MYIERIKFFPTKIGAGHYKIVVSKDYENVGEFITTDMQLVDDIISYNNNEDILNFDEKEYLEEYAINIFEKYLSCF